MKSDKAMRPGSGVWRKITSRSGPCMARQLRTRRSSVRCTRSAGKASGIGQLQVPQQGYGLNCGIALEDWHQRRFPHGLERVGHCAAPGGFSLRREAWTSVASTSGEQISAEHHHGVNDKCCVSCVLFGQCDWKSPSFQGGEDVNCKRRWAGPNSIPCCSGSSCTMFRGMAAGAESALLP